MIDHNLKIQLEKATQELNQTPDVEGNLIVTNNGSILHHILRADVDINLFGPMSQVISSSSSRLLYSCKQGTMKRVLVESSGGKALFLSLDNVHLIILMQSMANLGLVMVTAKRAADKIMELTHDLELTTPEIPVKEEVLETEETLDTEEIIKPVKPKVTMEDADEKVVEKNVEEIEAAQKVEETSLTELEPEISPDAKSELKEEFPPIIEDQSTTVERELEQVETESEVVKSVIPTVKPPISFPKLPDKVLVSNDLEERSELILEIYEAIFLAMALGAAKIMGTAPARGLTKQFLPFEECQRLLNGVDLKNNATIDFSQIRKNAEKISLAEREETFISDFSRMISIITENYGKVMGYEAFRAMVRPEFQAITQSYGEAMDKLGIKTKIHPEIASLVF
jgi:predicted regulator of Ras-like GTPase activity (Roadblock/LC7/MglB family)